MTVPIAERCYCCHRSLAHLESMRIDVDGRIADVCDICLENADSDSYLDEELDVADLNREGDPAFNGAFTSW